VVLEHGESDRDNPYHAATCYTADPLTGALFFWSAGDAHLIHHLFPYFEARERSAAGCIGGQPLPRLLAGGASARSSGRPAEKPSRDLREAGLLGDRGFLARAHWLRRLAMSITKR